MKQRLMPFYDRMMLRKRSIIESINDMLKNVAQLVHSRHRSVHNFLMNLLAAMGAYCFFATKPEVNFDFEVRVKRAACPLGLTPNCTNKSGDLERPPNTLCLLLG